MIDDYFKLLEDWKQLPSYKLETRIDSLVGFALPKILEHLYGIEIHTLIPEFPIRLGTIYPEHREKNFANRSYKVDFYARTDTGVNIFIEIKSDSRSRREDQDEYLRLSTEAGMRPILEGILTIYGVTSYKQKYAHLLQKLRAADLIDDDGIKIGPESIQVIYVQPRELEDDKELRVIGYDRLSSAVGECFPDSELMRRFADSVRIWAKD